MGRRFRRVVFGWSGGTRSAEDRAASARLADLEPLAARIAAGLRDHLFRLEPAVETLAIRFTPEPGPEPVLTATDVRGRGPVLTVDLPATAGDLATLPREAGSGGEAAIAALELAIARLTESEEFAATLPQPWLARQIALHRAEGYTWGWITANTRLHPAPIRARIEARADAAETRVELVLAHRRSVLGRSLIWRGEGARVGEASGWSEIRRLGERLILRHETRMTHPDTVVALSAFPGASEILRAAETAPPAD